MRSADRPRVRTGASSRRLAVAWWESVYATGFLDKGKPPVRVGRKAMGPPRIARLPKGH